MYTFLMLFLYFLDSCIFTQLFETMPNEKHVSNIIKREKMKMFSDRIKPSFYWDNLNPYKYIYKYIAI